MDHGRAVTKHFMAARNSLEAGYWDDVFRETEYFENQETPFDIPQGNKGNCVGELDVALVNWEDKTLYYKEVKTGYGDLSYAQEQIDRCDEFFDDWEVIGNIVLENGNG